MERKYLENLGLSKEQVEDIMAEHGKDLQKLKLTQEKTKEEMDAIKKQLEEANGQIETFKGMDVEGVKKAAEEWKEKAAQAQKDAAERIAKMEYDFAAKEYFSGVKFASESAKAGVMAAFRDKGFKLDNGKFLGADDWLKDLQETDKGAFAAQEPAAKVKAVQPTGKIDAAGNAITKEGFAKMGYLARLNLKQTNPNLYNQLKE